MRQRNPISSLVDLLKYIVLASFWTQKKAILENGVSRIRTLECREEEWHFIDFSKTQKMIQIDKELASHSYFKAN